MTSKNVSGHREVPQESRVLLGGNRWACARCSFSGTPPTGPPPASCSLLSVLQVLSTPPMRSLPSLGWGPSCPDALIICRHDLMIPSCHCQASPPHPQPAPRPRDRQLHQPRHSSALFVEPRLSPHFTRLTPSLPLCPVHPDSWLVTQLTCPKSRECAGAGQSMGH